MTMKNPKSTKNYFYEIIEDVHFNCPHRKENFSSDNSNSLICLLRNKISNRIAPPFCQKASLCIN